MTTPTQQAIAQATDYLNGNDLARPGFDEIRLLLAHIAELTREKEELVKAARAVLKLADKGEPVYSNYRQALRAALAKHQQTP